MVGILSNDINELKALQTCNYPIKQQIRLLTAMDAAMVKISCFIEMAKLDIFFPMWKTAPNSSHSATLKAHRVVTLPLYATS